MFHPKVIHNFYKMRSEKTPEKKEKEMGREKEKEKGKGGGETIEEFTFLRF